MFVAEPVAGAVDHDHGATEEPVQKCGGRISPQYPLVEAATGLAFAALAWKHGLSWQALWLAVLFSTLIAAAVTDAREMAVPVGWVALGSGVVAALKLVGRELAPWDLAAAAACWALFALAARAGFVGDGDAPVAALTGLALGPAGAAEALFWASVLGGICGAVLLVRDRRSRKRRIPLVPFFAAGSAVAVFWPGLFGFLVGL